ncbi:plasmid mobilization protein [Gluconobacter cerinus]|uniref:Mobilization protein n=1 Tax=Gluconobacter cerinus TaxID=38307 RepID=A0A1B6VJR1_9PROT|nr:plasmid mobilization relaxosome protein MobC [Gluconobacter cerinus]OAJ67450.1 mobilization protein [Gluconobacter cerinus]
MPCTPSQPAPSPPRSSRLSIRAHPAELEVWARTAQRHGHATTAHYVRSLLQEHAMTGQQTSELGPELRLLRLELSRIGNNLNQLAHATHCGEAVRCGDVLDAIETTKDRADRLLRSLPLPRRRRFFSQAEAQIAGPVLH